MAPLSILFGAAFTVGVCIACGRLLIDRPAPSRLEALVLSFLSGAAVVSFAVYWIALFRVAYWQTFLAAGVVVLVAGRRLYAGESACATGHQDRSAFLYWRVFGAFAAYYFVHALKPEASPDGATYHLGWVARALREHGYDSVPENLYWAFPKGLEMLYLVAFAFGKHSAAAMTHFAFLLAAGLGIFAYARSQGQPLAGMVGSLLFFLSPVVALDGTTAYADVALAATCFGAFWAVELWKESPSNRMLWVAGLLAGFSFSIKYTGVVAVVYVAASVLRRGFRFAVVLLPVALMIAPYLIRNWIVLGNPVSPFLNAWFPNRFVHLSFEQMAQDMMRNYPGLPSYWQWPAEATIRGVVLQGFLGPVFLLMPLALLALRSKLGRKWIVAGLVFAAPALGNVGARFVIPGLPFFALALGLVLSRWPIVAWTVVAVHAITVLPPVAKRYVTQGAPMLEGFPIHEALRIVPEETSLQRQAESYDLSRIIQKHVPADGTVLGLAWVMEAYTTPTIRTHHLSAANERLAETLWTPLTTELQPGRRIAFEFDAKQALAIRIVQTSDTVAMRTAHSKRPGFILNRPRIYPDQWGVAEIQGVPQGKTTASPNPWDAGLAVDGNPTTAWKTWSPAKPGAAIQIEFPRLSDVRTLALDTYNAQQPLAFRVEACDASRRCKQILARVTETANPLPRDMRRSATAALRREGITHVVIDPSLFGADDFKSQPEAWGMRFLDQASNGVRLYKLE